MGYLGFYRYRGYRSLANNYKNRSSLSLCDRRLVLVLIRGTGSPGQRASRCPRPTVELLDEYAEWLPRRNLRRVFLWNRRFSCARGRLLRVPACPRCLA
jgi:hypothetical protein